MLKPSDEQTDIAIIGGGVVGLVTALTLQDDGYAVHLYEKTPELGPQTCSWYAGGMIAPWCERDGAETEVIERGQQALTWWEQHYAGVKKNGSLVLSAARDRSEVLRFSRRTAEHVDLDAQGIMELEPVLGSRFHEGLFYPKEMHVDPREALPALAHSFVQRGGVLSKGRFVSADNLSEAFIIDCRGLSARHDLSRLRGVRGEMLRIHSQDVHFSRPIRLLHPRQPIYVVPRDHRILMVGATSIESDYDGPVTVRSAYEMLEAVQRLHPALGEADIIEASAGVRPAFPDNLPDIERDGRVIYANGLYRHGFLLSPWCAQKVAAYLQELCGEAA